MADKKQNEAVARTAGEHVEAKKIPAAESQEKGKGIIGGPLNTDQTTEQQLTSLAEMKGKGIMIRDDPQVADVTDIQPADSDKVLEVKVYRKWTSRNVPDPTPTALCFILLDRHGNAIQANVEVRDMRQFDMVLQVNSCYKISRYGCKTTESWQRTLENNTTLLFGRYTQALPLPDDGFPNHYFNFAAYNELAPRINARDSILTDYIVIIRNVTGTRTFGDATRNRVLRKNVEIQNLNGNSVTFSLWNEMTAKFELEIAMEHEEPIVIAVSSCIVKSYNEMLRPDMAVPLISHERGPDDEALAEEPVKISTLLQINPDTLSQHQNFTTEAVIIKIDEETEWYMNRCRTCNRKIEHRRPHWHCQPPDAPVIPDYSYCFKSIIGDVTGSALLTWFSPEAHALLPTCSEALAHVPDPDPFKLPQIIKDLEDTRFKFQVHFGIGSRKGTPRLVLKHVSSVGIPLLQQIEPAGSSSTPQPETKNVSPTELPSEILTPPPLSAKASEKKKQLNQQTHQPSVNSCSRPQQRAKKAHQLRSSRQMNMNLENNNTP